MFIVLEGGEGCGKGTQSRRLKQYLVDKGYEVVTGVEPGTSPLGIHSRDVLLSRKDIPMESNAQLLAFYLSRFQNSPTIVEPALDRKSVVLWDRWDHSSYAYQVYAGNADESLFWSLSKIIRRPDLTLILNVDNVEEALYRAKGVSGTGDRFEDKKLRYHEKVWEAYRRMPEVFVDDNVHVVSFGTIEEVWSRVKKIVDECIDHSP